MIASVKTWAQGEGGCVTRSLAQGLILPEDVHFFSGSTDESLATQLQWHTIAVMHHFFSLVQMYLHFFSFLCSTLLYYQAAQLVHVIEYLLKETVDDVEREKALKDVIVAIVKDKGKAA